MGLGLGMGLALLPTDVFGVRALRGVGQHPGQRGLDGTGVASGGIAMATPSPLPSSSWGGLMGFVWLSFPVNPLRLHDWGAAVSGDTGWEGGESGAQPALLCRGKLRHKPSGQQSVRKSMVRAVWCGQGAGYRHVPGCQRALGCGQGSGLCACSRLPPSARLQRRRLDAGPALPGSSCGRGWQDPHRGHRCLRARDPESGGGGRDGVWARPDAVVSGWRWQLPAPAGSRPQLPLSLCGFLLCFCVCAVQLEGHRVGAGGSVPSPREKLGQSWLLGGDLGEGAGDRLEGTPPVSPARHGATHSYLYWSSSLLSAGGVTSDPVSAAALPRPLFLSGSPALCLC